MKNFLLKISSLAFAAILLCAVFTGCLEESLPKLAAPEVILGQHGTAVWSDVGNALYYVYVIDDGEEISTLHRSVLLDEGQSFKVKAVSGSSEYGDSDFSDPLTYVKGELAADHTHTDINSDGFCDSGEESIISELSFYAVNDLHGKFMDTSTQSGLDEFTTYLKALYADTEREEILLSSGDMWQGTVESSSNKGQLMTEWMNDVGFTSMTLGNHEFDWGPDILTPNSELAEFPFLAINVTYQGKAVDYCKASTIVEKGGVKIGIIGAIGDCLSSISGEFSDGLSFATDDALTALVKNEADRLRNEDNCDFIVYSIHDGGDDFSSSGINSVKNSDMAYYDTELSDGYVDLVFEAHTHQRYILKDEYGVYHMQASSENRYISRANVSFNIMTKEYSVEPQLIASGTYAKDSIEDDPIVDELFDKYFPDSNPYDVIGYNRSTKNSEAIVSKVAELYYQKGLEVWGKKYNIVLGGGYLNARNPYNIYAGNVTYADLYSVLPFDNEIVLGRISGAKLISQFFNSKVGYTYVSGIEKSSIKNNETYYIIVDTYTAFYKWNYITVVERYDSGVYARDLLADFIKGGGWAK